MKTLTLALTLFLAACGGGGSAGVTSSPHIPDTTPHTYTAMFSVVTNTVLVHTGTLHQVCDFGLPDLRDESATLTLDDAIGDRGGVGCGPESNYTLTATNTGIYDLGLVVSIDGVNMPDINLTPGQTYNFQRGF